MTHRSFSAAALFAADSIATALVCLALAAAGPAGLVRALELLEEEVRICLGLLGVNSFAELTPRHLTSAPPVYEPSVLSAFPLLDLYENGAPPVNR